MAQLSALPIVLCPSLLVSSVSTSLRMPALDPADTHGAAQAMQLQVAVLQASNMHMPRLLAALPFVINNGLWPSVPVLVGNATLVVQTCLRVTPPPPAPYAGVVHMPAYASLYITPLWWRWHRQKHTCHRLLPVLCPHPLQQPTKQL
jgi:hypothetical protein